MNSRGPIGLGRKVTRAASGGVIVIVALLAVWFMQGPGTGDGESSDPGSSSSDSELLASANAGGVLLAADQQHGGLTEDEQAALSGNILIVLIDNYDYRMQIPGDGPETWQPVELARLAEVARQATGDSNGIRVRIEQRETARYTAKQKLLQELGKVGIGTDAIFESSKLLD